MLWQFQADLLHDCVRIDALQSHVMEFASELLRVRSTRAEFLWTIEGFSLLNSEVGALKQTEEFSLLGHRWRLDLYPGGSSDGTKGNVSMYLCNRSPMRVEAQFSLQFLNNKGAVLFSYGEVQNTKDRLSLVRTFQPKETKDLKKDEWCAWGFYKEPKRSDVLNFSKRFLDNDTLRIKCTISRVHSERGNCLLALRTTQYQSLHKDLGQLLDNPANRYLFSARAVY